MSVDVSLWVTTCGGHASRVGGVQVDFYILFFNFNLLSIQGDDRKINIILSNFKINKIVFLVIISQYHG